jgi:hypothetical protein
MSFTVPPGPPGSVHRLSDHRKPSDQDAAAEVWAEVRAAARLFGLLREAGLSVRFDPLEDATGVRVRITDLEGKTVREISPATAVDAVALAREALGDQAAESISSTG